MGQKRREQTGTVRKCPQRMDVGPGPLVLATVPTVPGRKLLYLGRVQQCGGRPKLGGLWRPVKLTHNAVG